MKDNLSVKTETLIHKAGLPVRVICASLWLLSILTLIIVAVIAAGRV